MTSRELPRAGPAWLLGQRGVMETAWDGRVEQLQTCRGIPSGTPTPRPCRTWEATVGDAGWAGIVAEELLCANGQPITLVIQPGMQSLALISEVIGLLPAERRWETSFSTYFTPLPRGLNCLLRCVLAGSPEQIQAERMSAGRLHDLTRPLAKAIDTPLVSLARSGNIPGAPDQHKPQSIRDRSILTAKQSPRTPARSSVSQPLSPPSTQAAYPPSSLPIVPPPQSGPSTIPWPFAFAGGTLLGAILTAIIFVSLNSLNSRGRAVIPSLKLADSALLEGHADKKEAVLQSTEKTNAAPPTKTGKNGPPLHDAVGVQVETTQLLLETLAFVRDARAFPRLHLLSQIVYRLAAQPVPEVDDYLSLPPINEAQSANLTKPIRLVELDRSPKSLTLHSLISNSPQRGGQILGVRPIVDGPLPIEAGEETQFAAFVAEKRFKDRPGSLTFVWKLQPPNDLQRWELQRQLAMSVLEIRFMDDTVKRYAIRHRPSRLKSLTVSDSRRWASIELPGDLGVPIGALRLRDLELSVTVPATLGAPTGRTHFENAGTTTIQVSQDGAHLTANYRAANAKSVLAPPAEVRVSRLRVGVVVGGAWVDLATISR